MVSLAWIQRRTLPSGRSVQQCSGRAEPFDDLLLTREPGRHVGEALPREGRLCLDLRGVGAASPSFLDELIRTATRRGIELSFTNVPSRIKDHLGILERANERRVEAV
jgi:hypothetical protein